jgi:hypothetical protein
VRGFVHEKTTVKHQTIGNFPTGRSPHLPESLGKNADGSVNPPTLEPTMPPIVPSCGCGGSDLVGVDKGGRSGLLPILRQHIASRVMR